MNADIDASADIDSTKIDLSSSGYLTSGQTTANITGTWNFAGQTNIDNLVASLATIGNINISTGAVTSLMSIAHIQAGYAEIASLATISNLYVENVNNAAYVSVPPAGWTNMEVFTSTGTWTKPASVDKVYVKVWGGGGSGGGGSKGGGGGSGGHSEGLIAVTGDVTVTIGAGGGIRAPGQNGITGGTSSFAGTTTIQATGGVGGTANNGRGGAGGSGSGGSVNISGGYGGYYSTTYGAGADALGVGNGGAYHPTIVRPATGYSSGGGGSDSGSSTAGMNGLVIVYWNE